MKKNTRFFVENALVKITLLQFIFVIFSTPHAHAMSKTRSLPSLYASLGDSMTAATLAGTSLDNYDNMLMTIEDYFGNTLLENKSTYSWASGTKIGSHIQLLNNFLIRNGLPPAVAINVAVPGNTAADLSAQVDNVVKELNTGKYSGLLYVTILIGANDACSVVTPNGTPDDQMHDQFMTALAKLNSIGQASKIRVLVSSIPRVPDLDKPGIADIKTLLGFSCHNFRSNFLHECPNLLNWTTSEEYTQKTQVIEDKNALLQSAVVEAQSLYPGLDVHYGSSIYSFQLTSDLLAIDCFHPNSFGQELVAENLWNDQPWFK